MHHQSVSIDDDLVRRRRRRDVLCAEVLTLRDMLVKQAAEKSSMDIDFGIPELVTEAAFCNGYVLLVTWVYDGTKDVEFPMHAHNAVFEHTAMTSKGRVVFETDDGVAKTLSKPGESFYTTPGEAHKVTFFSDGGPAHGWTTFQPPEVHAVPTDQTGNCLMRPFGRCGGDPTTCVLEQVKKSKL